MSHQGARGRIEQPPVCFFCWWFCWCPWCKVCRSFQCWSRWWLGSHTCCRRLFGIVDGGAWLWRALCPLRACPTTGSGWCMCKVTSGRSTLCPGRSRIWLWRSGFNINHLIAFLLSFGSSKCCSRFYASPKVYRFHFFWGMLECVCYFSINYCYITVPFEHQLTYDYPKYFDTFLLPFQIMPKALILDFRENHFLTNLLY